MYRARNDYSTCIGLGMIAIENTCGLGITCMGKNSGSEWFGKRFTRARNYLNVKLFGLGIICIQGKPGSELFANKLIRARNYLLTNLYGLGITFWQTYTGSELLAEKLIRARNYFLTNLYGLGIIHLDNSQARTFLICLTLGKQKIRPMIINNPWHGQEAVRRGPHKVYAAGHHF